MNLLAVIIGFIRNGMNNYEIVGFLEGGLTWEQVESIREWLKKHDEIYKLNDKD